MKRNIGTLFIAIVFFTIAITCIGMIIDEARYAWGGSGVGISVSKTTVTGAQPVVVVPVSPSAPAISPTDKEGFSSPTNTPPGAPDPEIKSLIEINAAKGHQPTAMPGK